jgi:hypothetical protein
VNKKEAKKTSIHCGLRHAGANARKDRKFFASRTARLVFKKEALPSFTDPRVPISHDLPQLLMRRIGVGMRAGFAMHAVAAENLRQIARI